MAELIDVCLFGLLLKLYIPDFEYRQVDFTRTQLEYVLLNAVPPTQIIISNWFFYRVPEIIFESNDVWKEIDEEELLEIRRLIIHFLVSTVVQRLAHAVCEV